MITKLFYVLPHCSTGGMPQYVLKQYQMFKHKFDITVVEFNNYGDEYTVQRKQFPKLVQCYGKTFKLLKLINTERPDIIHFQEVPESFIGNYEMYEIYRPDRWYNIVVTSHSSKTRRKDFKFLPDKLVAVSNWQKNLFEKEFPDTEVDIWEYPIEDKNPTFEQTMEARITLGFHSLFDGGKHILNVGLFTPGKNQGELFEMARRDPDNYYHFVGNQAPNFKSYWEPLMNNKPDNCFIWGERSDVDLFYKACHEMIFTSNFELNPICVKEALSYNLPVKMKRLETYGTDYDNHPLVTFI